MSRAERKGVNEVADRIFRLGSKHVNWYVVSDGKALTIVDTGLPGHWPQLESLLAVIGRSISDIDAVLLTHADPDHLGNAESIALASGAAVFIHHADIPAATGQVRMPPPRLPPWRPAVLSFMAHGIRNGLLRRRPISSPTALDGAGELDVPGHPRVVHVPGHTPGSVCFAFADRDAIAVGDALVNKDPATGQPGVQVSPKPISAD